MGLSNSSSIIPSTITTSSGIFSLFSPGFTYHIQVFFDVIIISLPHPHQSLRYFGARFTSSYASFRSLMRPISWGGSEDMEFLGWRHLFLFQSDIPRSVARCPFIFWRPLPLDYTFRTPPRSPGSDHPLLRSAFIVVPLLIPFCTRKKYNISAVFAPFCIVQGSIGI